MHSKESNLPIIGGIVAAFGAGLCCAGPLVLLLLGISGSWISNLTKFEPFRPYFILTVIALFAYAGWRVYRPIEMCEPGTACALPEVRLRRQVTFLITLLIAVALVTSNYWVVLIA